MENIWNVENTKKLFRLANDAENKGVSLAKVFVSFAEENGISAGSVRNYYYSQAKLFKMMPSLACEMGVTPAKGRAKPFVTFEESEARTLVEQAIVGKANGKSVRATFAEMAQGDETKALRYQNKYRSVLVHHSEIVGEVMKSLDRRGVKYFDPYAKSVVSDKKVGSLSGFLEKIEQLSAPEKEILLRKILS